MNDFISIYYINSSKGNFKFNCINCNPNIPLTQIELDNILGLLNNEKNIKLFVFNIMKDCYEKRLKLDMNIIEKLCKWEETEKNNIFFACPNNIVLKLKLLFLQYKINFIYKLKIIFSGNKLDDEKKKLIKETILEVIGLDKKIRNQFISSFFDFDCIFEKKKNKNIFCLYNLTMESYLYFYKIIIEKENMLDFSSFKEYLTLIKEKINIIDNKIKLFEEKKREIKQFDNKRKQLEEEKIILEEEKIKILKCNDDIKELKLKLDNINENIEKINSILENMQKKEEDIIDKNKLLNEEIDNFNSKLKSTKIIEDTNFDSKKLHWYEELLIEIINSFLPKEKNYSFIPNSQKSSKCLII